MNLTNNITGEHQALSDEMLSKRQVLFIQFTSWNNRFPYPFIYLNFWNPTFYVPEARKRYLFSGGASPYMPI